MTKKEQTVETVETRVAQIGIVVENPDSVEKLNALLHEYGRYIIGRMGIPYHRRNISIISVVLDAPMNVISGLSGKIGMLEGVTASAVYSKLS
ncbi:MAG: iron-only hydrogenase system regulator [Clostridia bacterium]|nr:iron-only hydrogenase system regulator [Clostridia bacterium]